MDDDEQEVAQLRMLEEVARQAERKPVLPYEPTTQRSSPIGEAYEFTVILLRRGILMGGAALLANGLGNAFRGRSEAPVIMAFGAAIIAFILPIPGWKTVAQFFRELYQK